MYLLDTDTLTHLHAGNLKRFLKLEILNIEKIWFLCLKEMSKQEERFIIKGLAYIAELGSNKYINGEYSV